MENVNALAFATELSKKFREACDTLRANGLDPTKDGVALSYGAMLALCDSIEHLERERDAAVERCITADDVSAGYYQEIEQLEAAQSKWISVEDRLPEDRENVLVYIASEKEGVDSVITITNYTHSLHGFNIEGWVSPWQYCFWDRKVTHWMLLPEAPKEEE